MIAPTHTKPLVKHEPLAQQAEHLTFNEAKLPYVVDVRKYQLKVILAGFFIACFLSSKRKSVALKDRARKGN